MNPLDPGPEVTRVWTDDSDERRQMAHFAQHVGGHLDFNAWGAHVLAMLGWHPPDDERRETWLDWGCGGGAVARAIFREFEPSIYHAIDISADALAECAKAVDDEAYVRLKTHHPQHVALDGIGIESASVRYLFSTACFQHFPSFDYARAVLREMRRVAAPGSRGLIQTRYFQPGDSYDPADNQAQPYEERSLRYCAWQVPEFWRELADAGFSPHEVVFEPGTQYAWYRFGG